MHLRILALFLLPAALAATDFIWNAADNPRWTSNANWLPADAHPGAFSGSENGNITTDTAVFADNSANATVLLDSASLTIGNIVFDTAAPFRDLTLTNATLVLSETGVTNNSGSTQNITVGDSATIASLLFSNNASADATGSGAVHITTGYYGGVWFIDNASAGNAVFHNNAGYYDGVTFGRPASSNTTTGETTTYDDAPSAGNATFHNASGATIAFHANSTAANAVFLNNGTLTFNDNATAGGASVTAFFTYDENANATVAPAIAFNGNSSAANATFILSPNTDANSTLQATLDFNDNASAANASITAANAAVTFNTNATAAGATFDLDASTLAFNANANGSAATSITLAGDSQLQIATTSGNITLGTLSVAANSTASLLFTSATSQTLTLETDADLDFSRLSISESGAAASIRKAGSGNLTLATVSITGTIALDAGTLSLTQNSTLQTATLELNNSAALSLAFTRDETVEVPDPTPEDPDNVRYETQSVSGLHDTLLLGGLAGNATLDVPTSVSDGNTTLDFAGFSIGHNNADATFSGVLTGSGNIAKHGSGAWILSGATGPYDGNLSVISGALELDNASLPAAAVSVGNIIYLDADGNVTTDRANATIDYTNSTAATLRVAAGPSEIGSLTLGEYSLLDLSRRDNATLSPHPSLKTNGDLTLDDNAVLYLGAYKDSENATATYSTVEVGGALTLTQNATLLRSSVLVAIDTTSAIFKTGDTLADILTFATNNSALADGAEIETTLHNALVFEASVSASSVTLTAKQLPFAGFGKTPNQKTVGAALDRIVNGTGYDTNLAILLNNYVPGDRLPAAFDQLSPASLAVMADLAFDATKRDLDSIDRRLRDHHDDLGEAAAIQSMSEPVFTLSTPAGNVSANASSLAAAPDASGIVPVRPAPASSLPWAAYLSASGGGGAAYNDSNAPGYNHTLGLFALGVERALHARLVFGARVGYHKTAAKLRADSGRVDASGWHALAYAGWQFPQGTRFHAVLRHASYDYDTRRHILSPAVMAPDRAAALGSYYDYTAAGSTSGSSTAAALSLSHDWKFGALRDWKTGPIALLAAESVTVDAFSETGTDNGPQAAMRVGRQIPESLRTRLGWRLGWEASDLLDNSAWFLDLRLAWQREHRDTARPVTGSFTNPEYEIAGPVRVLGNKQPRDTLVAGLGVQYRHSRRLRAALAYDLETGAHDTTHTATLSATLRW